MITLENGAQLHYEWINEKSEGPVIVFLHEGLGSVQQWKKFPAEVCDRFNLTGFTYDRQGHGKSDPLSEERDETYLEKYAFEELPQIIEAQLKNRPLILYGHSDGGTIALLYASKFPKNVIQIFTEAAHIYVEPVTWEGIEPVIQEFKLKEKLYHSLQKYHGTKFDQTFYAWANAWKKKNENNWDVSHYLENIQAPLVAMQGDQDQYATRKHLYDICKLVSGNSTPILIEDCKHSPFIEQREEVIATLTKLIIND